MASKLNLRNSKKRYSVEDVLRVLDDSDSALSEDDFELPEDTYTEADDVPVAVASTSVSVTNNSTTQPVHFTALYKFR
jgi:hypothetical protein